MFIYENVNLSLKKKVTYLTYVKSSMYRQTLKQICMCRKQLQDFVDSEYEQLQIHVTL